MVVGCDAPEAALPLRCATFCPQRLVRCGTPPSSGTCSHHPEQSLLDVGETGDRCVDNESEPPQSAVA